jgi:hypothetical protein
MRHQFRSMYRRDGWILAECVNCKRVNYVEPHGTTGKCSCSQSWVEHTSIPYSDRNLGGTEVCTVKGRIVRRVA